MGWRRRREQVAILLAVVAMTMMVQVIQGAVHKVGDSAGWTTIGNPDYKQWAATKTFHVGDLIVFEYNPQFHNVMRVNHTMYRACNGSAPMATFTTGNDSITITTHGHHYYFCGVPGHCQTGQKVDINVLRDAVTAPSPSSTDSVPSAMAPGPVSNGALSLNAPKSVDAASATTGLAMAIMAALLYA